MKKASRNLLSKKIPEQIVFGAKTAPKKAPRSSTNLISACGALTFREHFRDRGSSKHCLVMFLLSLFLGELFQCFLGPRTVCGPRLCWFRHSTLGPKGRLQNATYPSRSIGVLQKLLFLFVLPSGLERVLGAFMLILGNHGVARGTLFFAKREVFGGSCF